MIGIVGTRLAAAAALLLALCFLQAVTGDLFSLLVALALVAVPVLSWATYWFFGQRSLAQPEILTLRIRTQDAFALALASTVGAFLGLITVLRQLDAIPPVDRAVFLVGLSFALLMIAAPAVNWLVVWKPWKAS